MLLLPLLLLQGLSATILRNVPANSVFLGTFELLKRTYAEAKGINVADVPGYVPLCSAGKMRAWGGGAAGVMLLRQGEGRGRGGRWGCALQVRKGHAGACKQEGVGREGGGGVCAGSMQEVECRGLQVRWGDLWPLAPDPRPPSPGRL